MKVQIIGLGNLGLFLVRHFSESGFQVSGWDIDPGKQDSLWNSGGVWSQDLEKDTDAIIFAMFPEQIEREVELVIQNDKNLNPNTLFVNVSSVQTLGIKTLINSGVKQERIFSFHPLFGPVGVSKSGWAGKQIIVTAQPENDNRATALLETFTRKGVVIDHMSPEEHDIKMLPHALAFLIAELVKVGAEGADPRFLTGSGRQMLGLLDFTEAGSEELRNLILSNPALKPIFPKLQKVLKKLAKQHGW